MNKKKHIFLLAGEASGDALAAWYLGKTNANATYTGVTGPAMRACGVHSHADITDLNVVGIAEIVRHLPRLLRLIRQMVDHIVTTGYDEVVLVDFPGFNLRVLKKLKQKRPDIRVTYLSPPQMWVWGAWRVKPLARYADRVVVLYPFEVAWYAQRGVQAEWIGSPVAERIAGQCVQHELQVPVRAGSKQYQLSLLPGSRSQEVTGLMKVYAPVIQQMCKAVKGMRIVVVVAPTITQEQIEQALAPYRPESWGAQWKYVSGDEALPALAHSVCALTKPGTNTLELALLGVPTVVVYKTSWLTYWLARLVVKVESMTLPNLLTGQQLFDEFIQGNCVPEVVAAQLCTYLHEWRGAPQVYEERCGKLSAAMTQLSRYASTAGKRCE